MQTADELRQQIDELTAAVARNEDKMRRSQRRELRLLQSEDLKSLFTELTAGLRASYGLQYVSVVLVDPDHDIRHLMMAAGTPVEDIDTLIFVETLSGLAPQFVALSQPWLGPFSRCDHQLIFEGGMELASVAMIPLRVRGNLVGSINLGSSDPTRFTREHASDFLAHLGLIAGFCIENTVNRARLLRSGFTDVLTGWHNRRYLLIRLREELARASRDGTSLVCLMLDIDHFKAVNDSWGHAAGDSVLRDIAQRIESQVRASDVAARYGGEEFIVLLPDTSIDDAERLAERIRRAVSGNPIGLPGGGETRVTASIGIASVKPEARATDLKTIGEALIARADVALYKAKADGRDRVVTAEAA
ncbi:MAG: DUF484 family protein [Woeseiaceae bacterium]|nr:DUF484 family protein [Woeseiaceae bacterium]